MDELLNYAKQLAEQEVATLKAPIAKRIAYVVSHGQSYANNGYAIRTQGIAKALNDHGFETLCFIRPGRPWEFGAEQTVPPVSDIDGVRYIHSRWEKGVSPQGEEKHLKASVDKFVELFNVFRPSIVLAGSNFIIGLPAYVAAKKLGIPFYNEVRGFWEISRAAREPGFELTESFKQEAARDTFVAKQAQKVFTLNHSMKDELVQRGIKVENIKLVANGVNRLPSITLANPALQKELGITEEEKVIGYIGSFSSYEGLDVLLDACTELVRKGERLKLLLVGDDSPFIGSSVADIAEPALSGRAHWLIQVGRVPHEDVADYYALLDAVVIPRKPLPVCQLVPPMKAAEALAYGKRLVVSDVSPLAEYAQKYDGVVSFAAGSATSLAQALQRSLRLPAPKPSTELLFSEHSKSIIEALKGKGSWVAKPAADKAINKFELTNTPKWQEVEVSQGQSITVKGNVQYHNAKDINDRKAVMIIKAYDYDDHELNVACGALTKSQLLSGYYKYLPCSQGTVLSLHSFEVPNRVAKIKIGFRLFHAHEVKVIIDNFEVNAREKISSSVHKTMHSVSGVLSGLSKFLDENIVPPKVVNKKNNKDYNVLTIMDEFTQDCFRDEFNLISAEKTSWREQLDNHSFDMFFAESAWRGNDSTWSYCMSKIKGKFGVELLELLLECKRQKIPTVFWNKEDPVNYDVFIDAAKYFDYVFTTDESVIEKYKEDVGHERVYLLKFAAQEKLHSPILKGKKNGRVAFAGSWNGKKYPTRAERLEMLFEYPLEKGILDIYDRYSSLENTIAGLTYPEKFKGSLLPAIPYNKIADQVYKKYSAMINVNSVENSSSMLARRIYELCGCGTPIISSPANSLTNELCDIVQIASNAQEARQKTSRVLNDEIHALRLSAKGVRFVHRSNTYRHRFSEILNKVVESREIVEVDRFSVTAICVSKRPWFAANVARMLKAQTGVDVKVKYVAHGDETNEEEVNEAFRNFESFKFMRITGEGKVLADGLNLALDSCDTDIVAKIDDDDYYGPNYLLDSCLALQYSGAALVGKTSFFCYVESTNDFALRFPGKHYRFFKRVQGGTLVWSRERADGLKFTKVRQGTDSIFIKDLLNSGKKVFSSDPFNFVHVRYSSGNNHTWAIDDDKFMESAEKLGNGLLLDLAFV